MSKFLAQWIKAISSGNSIKMVISWQLKLTKKINCYLWQHLKDLKKWHTSLYGYEVNICYWRSFAFAKRESICVGVGDQFFSFENCSDRY